jgi:sRNA-binding protein/(2Fe-2S) ferredoxin
MESAMSARSGAMAGCLSNENRGINTNNVAVSLGRVSLSSNRQTAPRIGFSDQSHLQYYGGLVKPYCGKKNKFEKLKLKHLSGLSDKKKVNLLELLPRDLYALPTTPADANASLTEQVRGQILTDAVNVLMRQFEQAKAERKERKRQLKAQKKALKLAEKQRKNKGCCEDSSSSSTDSESEAVDMTQQVGRILDAPQQSSSVLIASPPNVAEVNGHEKALHVEFTEASDRLGLNSGVGITVQEANSVIKVCMGGKCKKSGSEVLLGAFEERISKSGMGCEVEAVGCKCMGKCRNAPVVRVQTEEEEGFHGGKGAVHMGVDIEDVNLIIGQHFGLNLQLPKEGEMVNG